MDRAALLDHLEGADGSKDFVHSIGSAVVRCRYDGARAVAVGSDADTKTQIDALVDLLDLHLSTPPVHQGEPVDPHRLVVLLGGRPGRRAEAVDALARLVARQDRFGIEVLEADGTGGWLPAGSEVAADPRAAAYRELLCASRHSPPPLVRDLLEAVARPELRAYPMLTSRGARWSLRVEGLQVGEVGAKGGWLDVGTPKSPGRERQHWQVRTGWTEAVAVSEGELPALARGLRAFAATWLAAPGSGPARQDEHALESRVLRGAVAVDVGGEPLALLQADAHVNRGSQFPNRWGRDGRARYLDGLLRRGATPWALEMKVEVSSGGLRQYYRHGVVQAVLYRDYILRNADLDPWFSQHGLQRSDCRAALVVPELPVGSPVLAALQRVCDVFDVALAQVPRSAAEVSPAALSAA